MRKMDEAARNKHQEALRIKQGIYTTCFVLFCLIDQLVGSAAGKVQQTAVNCGGLLIGAIILTAYHWRDFIRLPYLIWLIVWMLGGGYVLRNYDSSAKWVIAVLNAGIYGCLLIRILIKIYAEKKAPRMNWPFFGIWVAMMLGMVFSRNESVWPVWFLAMFACFYLTEYSREEQNALFNGMLNGIIIGFCILQGFATMYRAFDELRYTGMYTNCNMYALFCLMTHAAILGKWYQFKKRGSSLAWRVLAGAGSGILPAYCFLSIGRTAMIVMCINTVLLVVLLFFQEKQKRILKAAGRLTAVALTAIAAFPAVFYSVRVIPAEFYSAMILAGDSGNKIQGMVPLEDDRYIEMDEFLEAALGRLFWFFQPKEEARGEASAPVSWVSRLLAPSLKVHAAEAGPEAEPEIAEKKPWGSGLDENDPVLTDPNDAGNPIMVRWAIYRTYLKRLNLWGHRNGEHGCWITERGYYAIHAHNFLLQIMFSFGIVTGLLFLLVAAATLLHCLKRCLDKSGKDGIFVVGVFMITSFVGFGTLEIDWRLGQLSFTALFVVQYLLLHQCGTNSRKAQESIETAGPGKAGRVKSRLVQGGQRKNPRRESGAGWRQGKRERTGKQYPYIDEKE